MIWRIMYISEELRCITVSKVCVILHIMLILRFWSYSLEGRATTRQPRLQGAFPWLWRWGGAFSHPTSKAGEKRPGDEVDYAKRAATPRGFKLICTHSSRGAATQAINPATNRLSIFTIASNKIRVNCVFDHWRHLEKFARREMEPKYVLQLFLGSLLETRWWPIAHVR